MANHLIIGLGGTGGKILREIRKRIYEEYRSNEPGNGVYVDYLYVDSSPADLNNKSDWRILGQNVHLLPAQKVSIHGADAKVLDELHLHPNIHSFISESELPLFGNIRGLVGTGIGGQRRRLGRFLFANSVREFNNSLNRRVLELQKKSNEAAVTFHICAGLAGGTGSGSIIDAIAQIRKTYHSVVNGNNAYKIVLYLYVPETVVANPSFDANYYQANGYAALCELNSMSVGAYRPFDVSGEQRDEQGRVKRLLEGQESFEVAYLFSNQNEVGQILDISTELPRTVADYIFQSVISAGRSIQMERIVDCENNGKDAEKDGEREVHSRKFMTFGVKRIEYPETEIEEFISYSFARQAARQLKYNKWIDGIGYDELSIDQIGTGFITEIQEKKKQEELWLSDKYMTLSKPFFESDATRKWKVFDDQWSTTTERFAEDCRTEAEKRNWLSKFTEMCELLYNENFRGQGVRRFFDLQMGEKKGYAVEVRRHIEDILFSEWYSGYKSLLEVEKYLMLIITDCEEKTKKYKEKVANMETALDQEIIPEANRCLAEWAEINWLKEIFGKSTKVFEGYKNALREKYILKTTLEGYRYANVLIQEVGIELSGLLTNVRLVKDLLTFVLDQAEEECKSKCRKEPAGIDEKIVKKYDPQQVREITANAVVDIDRQKLNAQEVRNGIVEVLGNDARRDFAALNEKLDVNTLQDIFSNICLRNAKAMMDDVANTNSTMRLSKVNILEKIKNEYNTDEKLENFITSIIRSANCYLTFNGNEINKGGVARSTLFRFVQLVIPKYEDPFREKFIQMFAQCCPGFDAKLDCSESGKENRIVVVAAASGFPLRFVANLTHLGEVYKGKFIGNEAEVKLNKMVLHTEGDGSRLAPLFDESIGEKTKKITPTAMLLFAMGLPADVQDTQTGERYKGLMVKNEMGFITNNIKLGTNAVQAIKHLATNSRDADIVTQMVEEKLVTDYLHNDKKVELQKALAELINTDFLAACSGNIQNPEFKAYNAVALKLITEKLTTK